MLSIIGAVLVIGASATFGVLSLWRMQTRIRVLSALLTALSYMKSEIADRMTPIPELIEALIRESDPPVDRLFRRVAAGMGEIGAQSLYFIWRTAVMDSQELELRDTERQSLIDLGRALGRYDAEEQRDAFAYTIRRFEGYLRRAEEERRNQGRVHAILGIVVGVFVVIILL